jgi:hypothetical protein
MVEESGHCPLSSTIPSDRKSLCHPESRPCGMRDLRFIKPTSLFAFPVQFAASHSAIYTIIAINI